MTRLLEIACFSYEAALCAAKAGAHRIELCHNYCVGGLTPLKEDILKLRKELNIPLHVIIRPREGNFVYTEQELDHMKHDIAFCRDHDVQGIVFGVLTDQNTIDTEMNKTLLSLCEGMSTTFHRAIDACADYDASLETLVSLGFKRVLTSGGEATVMEGTGKIKQAQKKWGHKIIILPGGGIRSGNLKNIANETECREFHSAAIKAGSEMPSEKEIQTMLRLLGNQDV